MSSVLNQLRSNRTRTVKAGDATIQSAKFNRGNVNDFYHMGRELGRGGFARVVQAQSKRNASQVAIKIIDKGRASRKQIREVQSEVEILEKLNHTNIVNLLEVFDDDKSFYIVMELITGGELFDQIVAKKSYSERDAVHVVVQVLHGLAHMHDLGIVHRDIKPENLLLSSNYADATIKLVDFGCSKILTPKKPLLYDFIGSPGYIAPEAYAVKEWRAGMPGYGLPIDMWALGVIVYILLSGMHPFPVEDEYRLETCVARGEWSMNGNQWRSISEDAKDFIRKLLVVDPDNRMNVQQALRHPWITGSAPTVALPDVHKELKMFNARRKFKGAIKALLALYKVGLIATSTSQSDISHMVPKAKQGAQGGQAAQGGYAAQYGEGARPATVIQQQTSAPRAAAPAAAPVSQPAGGYTETTYYETTTTTTTHYPEGQQAPVAAAAPAAKSGWHDAYGDGARPATVINPAGKYGGDYSAPAQSVPSPAAQPEYKTVEKKEFKQPAVPSIGNVPEPMKFKKVKSPRGKSPRGDANIQFNATPQYNAPASSAPAPKSNQGQSTSFSQPAYRSSGSNAAQDHAAAASSSSPKSGWAGAFGDGARPATVIVPSGKYGEATHTHDGSAAQQQSSLPSYTPGSGVYPYQVLVENPPADVDKSMKENYLSDAEFAEVFFMNRSSFQALPGWKQTQLKKDVGLF